MDGAQTTMISPSLIRPNFLISNVYLNRRLPPTHTNIIDLNPASQSAYVVL